MDAQNRFTCGNLEMLLLPTTQGSSDSFYGVYRFNGKQNLTTTSVAGMSGIVEIDRASAIFFLSDPRFFYGTEEDLEKNQPSKQLPSLHDFSDKVTKTNKHYYLISLSSLRLTEPRQIMIDHIYQVLCERFPSHYASHFLFVPLPITCADPRLRAHRLFLRFPERFRGLAQRQGAVYQHIPDLKTVQESSPSYLALPEQPLQRSFLSLGYFPSLLYPQEINFFSQPSERV
jgi:hypothetical protein